MDKIQRTFAKFGYSLIENFSDNANEYYKNGKQVNRVDVLRSIAKAQHIQTSTLTSKCNQKR